MRKSIIVVDLSYGDAGKGCITDYLASLCQPKAIVKCSGGHQCGHNVKVGDFEHCFAQLGSGSQAGIDTVLCGDFILEPLSLLNEMEGLSRIGGVFADPDLPVTTPYEVAVNRNIEAFTTRHGSCGKGIGQTRISWHKGIGLTVNDLRGNLRSIVSKLRVIRSDCESRLVDAGCGRTYWVEQSIYEVAEAMQSAFDKSLTSLSSRDLHGCIYEGSQGFFIDQHHGSHPHTTWSDVTSRNALELSQGNAIVVGVIRSYVSRHGDGPMFGYPVAVPPEKHNTWNEWQGAMRTTKWDIGCLSHAMEVNKVDYLAVNHLDVNDEVLDRLPNCVAIHGYGPDRADKKLTKIGEKMLDDLA